MDGAVARAKLYLDSGADAIFPEALNNREMFSEFSRRIRAEGYPEVKLLANMTEFGRTPFYTAEEFQAMGYQMVIWPVSAARVANKAMEELFVSIKAEWRDAQAGRPDADPGRALRHHQPACL